jgi:SH3-like domain-containing protein
LLATHTFCAVTERTPDGFVNLREGPSTQYKVMGKVLPSDVLDVATEQCRDDFGQLLCDETGKWVFVEAVYSLTHEGQKNVSGYGTALKGWAKNSLIRQIPCAERQY